jgi:large subunit ribosomal protein L22
MKRDYSVELTGEKVAKAQSVNMDVSFKHCAEICREIKGMKLLRAREFLKNVIERKEFVPFRRYNRGVGHRKGGTPGRYPEKASKLILKILDNVQANAEFKGMDEEKLKVVHAQAHSGPTYDRRFSKGRWKRANIETTSVEVIVKEGA